MSLQEVEEAVAVKVTLSLELSLIEESDVARVIVWPLEPEHATTAAPEPPPPPHADKSNEQKATRRRKLKFILNYKSKMFLQFVIFNIIYLSK